MAQKQLSFADLKLNEIVTLKLKTYAGYRNTAAGVPAESVLVGKVTQLPTNGGGAKVTLLNNRNSVVIYEDTNFTIFGDRGPSVGDVLGGFAIGTVFTFKNRFNVTKKWVKTGDDRVTLVDNTRPAHSLSISEGFPAAEEAGDRIRRA